MFFSDMFAATTRRKRKVTVFLRKTLIFLNKVGISENTLMLLLAAAVGVLGGYGSVVFRMMINGIQGSLFSPGAAALFTETVASLQWYRIFWVPALGGLAAGLLIYFFAPEAKGHGVPEVMAAVALKGGRIRPRVAVVKSLASALSIGTGGNLGREGPIAQIGSAVGSTLGQLLGFSKDRIKTLVGCGAAAGIAATFNAPIAGAMFSLEIILADFGMSAFSPIVISSVTATVISRIHLGDYPAFQVPPYELVSVWEMPLYVALGVLMSLVALIYVSTLYRFEDFWDRLGLPAYTKPMLGGLILGVAALKLPHVLGIDYGTIEKAVNNNLVWWLMLVLVAVKILGTSLTVGSGGSGGVFAPSLFIGCMAGGTFGCLVHTLFPDVTAHPGAYAIVGMGTLVAGTTHAPLTAIIILFEMTDDYQIILPLMLASIMCTVITMSVREGNIYTLKLLKRGLNIARGKEMGVLLDTPVYMAMNSPVEKVFEEDSLQKLKRAVTGSRYTNFPVVDRQENLTGFLSFQDFREVLFDPGLEHLVIARDIAREDVVTVSENDNLKEALDILEENYIEQVPVVSRRDPRKVVGMLSRGDIISAYNSALKKKITNSG